MTMLALLLAARAVRASARTSASDVPAIPSCSFARVVAACAKKYRDAGCDAIIAVGGGSVIDTSKGLNILVSENADELVRTLTRVMNRARQDSITTEIMEIVGGAEALRQSKGA